VATVHDLSVFKYPEAHPRARIEHFEREFHLSLSRAAHLITDSQSTRDEVIAFLGWPESRITAVPLGVSPRFAPRTLDALAPCLRKYGLSAGTYALCVSTLEPRKKIDRLLEAYQTLPAETRRAFPLVLAGSSGWLSEKLQREIVRLSEQGWLRYLRFVPEADLPSIYAGARLFVYPSIYEGFGLPVAEAMASGVPVVTSDRSSLPEVTKGSALLVDPDDVAALAGAIETGLHHDDWRHDARSKGLSVAEDYSWDTCVDRTMEVYGSAIRMA
jgi:alpha-1,3-rhamnosyl/mannosyltransferase